MLYIEVYKYERALGGSYIVTPPSLAKIKATINPDNSKTQDDKCLHYALIEYFFHIDNNWMVTHPERLSIIQPYLSKVNMEGIPMPTPICPRIFTKIKKQNAEIGINV